MKEYCEMKVDLQRLGVERYNQLVAKLTELGVWKNGRIAYDTEDEELMAKIQGIYDSVLLGS